MKGQHLYKYRDFNEHALDDLIENKLTFGLGETFNDPFDTSMGIPSVWFEFNTYRELTKIRHPSLTPSDIEVRLAFANEGLKYSYNPNGNDSLNHIIKSIKFYLSHTYIHCLSERNDSILMWSHYANSHQGLCIRYKKDVLLNSLKLQDHGKIKYSNERIDLLREATKNENTPFRDFFFKKMTSWNYEEEYRLILSSKSPYIPIGKDTKRISIEIPDDSVDMVILGLLANYKKALKLKKSLPSHIKFKQMKRIGNSYNIGIDPKELSLNDLEELYMRHKHLFDSKD